MGISERARVLIYKFLTYSHMLLSADDTQMIRVYTEPLLGQPFKIHLGVPPENKCAP